MNKHSNRITIYCRDHVSSGAIKRVWRSDWSGDMFEIMSDFDWEKTKAMFDRFGFQTIELGDDEEQEK